LSFYYDFFFIVELSFIWFRRK